MSPDPSTENPNSSAELQQQIDTLVEQATRLRGYL